MEKRLERYGFTSGLPEGAIVSEQFNILGNLISKPYIWTWNEILSADAFIWSHTSVVHTVIYHSLYTVCPSWCNTGFTAWKTERHQSWTITEAWNWIETIILQTKYLQTIYIYIDPFNMNHFIQFRQRMNVHPGGVSFKIFGWKWVPQSGMTNVLIIFFLSGWSHYHLLFMHQLKLFRIDIRITNLYR